MDLTNTASLRALLSKHGIRPNKRMGQNFLVSRAALDKIVGLAEIDRGDFVIEIGAGPGVLTQALVEAGARVVAVEKDRAFEPLLKEQFPISNFQFTSNFSIFKPTDSNPTFIMADARRFDPISHSLSPVPYAVVANLPYYASTFFLRQFLSWRPLPRRIVVTLQRELAERAAASPPDMSKLSVMLQSHGEVKLGSIIRRTAFWPQPEVDSRILAITDVRLPDVNTEMFMKLVSTGFASKRKKLSSNLAQLFGKDAKAVCVAFERLGISPNARAQELSIEQWVRLLHTVDNSLCTHERLRVKCGCETLGKT